MPRNVGAVPTKPCFMPYCCRRIPRRLLMCAPHWNAVPPALQADVYRTVKRIGTDLRSYVLATHRAALAVVEKELAADPHATDLVQQAARWLRAEVERLEKANHGDTHR